MDSHRDDHREGSQGGDTDETADERETSHREDSDPSGTDSSSTGSDTPKPGADSPAAATDDSAAGAAAPLEKESNATEPTLESTFDRIRRTLLRAVEMLQGSRIDVSAYDPEAHGPLVDTAPPITHDDDTGDTGPGTDAESHIEEIERYWVNAPFSYVVIQYDSRRSQHRYRTVEPQLDEDERLLLETLLEDVRDPLLYRDSETEDVETVLLETIHEYLERYGAEVDMRSFYRIFYYIFRDFRGYGRLDPIMHDPHVEDISCDGYDLPIFVYHDQFTDVKSDVSFEADDLDRFVIRLAQHSGRHISVGDPMVETTLPDGSRAELALGEEVTPRGSAFTIRKYADEPLTPIDLIEYGTFSVEQMAYLWLAIEHNKSLIFAGGTASGKTTSMNAISMFVPPRSKVLTIEDTRELQLYHDNWLSSVTRERLHEGKDVSMYDLLRSALRHRPEYIVVGEVRGEEAITLFQAMNTGHTTYSTMHADSVQTVINRLENEPINVPRAMVQSLDILSVQMLTRIDGERVRRNKVLAEIEGVDQRTGELDYSTAYRWHGESDTYRHENSRVLEEIRTNQGWSQRELLTERRNREAFLEYALENGVSDYRRFTALVNEYYANKERVMAVVEEASDEDSRETDTDDAEIEVTRPPEPKPDEKSQTENQTEEPQTENQTEEPQTENQTEEPRSEVQTEDQPDTEGDSATVPVDSRDGTDGIDGDESEELPIGTDQ
ncbi:ATPase, T2SS/T4P/T4SS family [Halobacteria archaeon AArc-curdl1]|uniref:ATPase, T2SS/T4P/T4SS family n=1 Tax=Natronosalvus hydrolyticus TaxID=2979988 RepID=A0AAP3E7K2_9EURY|nr:ATPase, T2SS/T4P/T4SS family [Halobacteria archaeon AArc-curdl1]